jgi:hypothetical protein
MAFTWDPPSDTELAVGKYFTSSKAKRIRDMCRAIAEGASGADKIATNGITNDAVTLSKLAHGTAGYLLGFGGSGQPSELRFPSGVNTSQTNQDKVLRPNGSNGVAWVDWSRSRGTMSSSYGDSSLVDITVDNPGQYLILGMAKTSSDKNAVGMCWVTDGAITYQVTLDEIDSGTNSSFETDKFSISSNDVSYYSTTTATVHLLALRTK